MWKIKGWVCFKGLQDVSCWSNLCCIINFPILSYPNYHLSDSVQFSSSFFLSMAHYQFSQHHLSDSLRQPFFAAPSIHSCYRTCARPIQFKMKTANSLFVGSAIFVRGVYNQFLGPSLPFGYRLWGVQILQSSFWCDKFYMQNTDLWRCTNEDETHWVQTASIWNLNTSSGGNF